LPRREFDHHFAPCRNRSVKSFSTSSLARRIASRVSTINSSRETIFVADAHRDDGKRLVVHTDERLTAIEIRPHRCGWKAFEAPGVEPGFPPKDQAMDYALQRVLPLG